MLDKMTYTNHLNEQIVLGENPYYANYSDLRDYSWDYTEANSKILSFNKGIREYTLPVTIMCKTEAEGYQRRNDMYEIMEKDVLAGKYGTLEIGQYKLQCYVKDSAKSDFLQNKKHMIVNLVFVTDRPYWVKEKEYVFQQKNEEQGGASEFLDFDIEYAYDYTNSIERLQLVNQNFVASNFRLAIYGEALNPRVSVNGHVYEVSGTVEAGQHLIIDSIAKTVTLHTKNGAVINKFNERNKDSYIFEKIPAGDLMLSRSDNFRFDLTLIEERGEPKWT